MGGGVDLIAACDLRLATTQARFSIKEVDLAIVADLGSLQRLAPVLGYARLAELAYTAQEFDGATAERLGLVSRTFATRAELLAAAAELAQCIAAKSGITVRGLKRNLLYARDHDVAAGLEYAASWNSSALLSADLQRAIEAASRRGAKTLR
jgi:enoyl-CoA hydratase/carnithine racemase